MGLCSLKLWGTWKKEVQSVMLRKAELGGIGVYYRDKDALKRLSKEMGIVTDPSCHQSLKRIEEKALLGVNKEIAREVEKTNSEGVNLNILMYSLHTLHTLHYYFYIHYIIIINLHTLF